MIGIIGLGLIGGSLAKSIKAHYRRTAIVAFDVNRQELDKALLEHTIDVAADSPDSGFSACELIFLCTPLSAMTAVVKQLLPHLKENCLFVDTGSTKMDVMSLFSTLSLENRFIGGHPMAGSEKSGYGASRANLFENAYFILTPYRGAATESLEAVLTVVRMTGAIAIVMDAEEHDKATAMISHMPHAMAALLVEAVQSADAGSNVLHRLAAGGFKDITRIASSSAPLWTGICLSNSALVQEALRKMQDGIQRFLEMLQQEDAVQLQQFFQNAADYRNSFSTVQTNPYSRHAEMTIDVEDKPGIISKIAVLLADAEINIKNIGINNVREEDEGALLIRFETMEEANTAAALLQENAYRVKKR